MSRERTLIDSREGLRYFWSSTQPNSQDGVTFPHLASSSILDDLSCDFPIIPISSATNPPTFITNATSITSPTAPTIHSVIHSTHSLTTSIHSSVPTASPTSTIPTLPIATNHYPLDIPHDEERYSCRLCTHKPYVMQGGLTRHLKKEHKKEIIFRCRWCQVLFTTVKECKNHQKRCAVPVQAAQGSALAPIVPPRAQVPVVPPRESESLAASPAHSPSRDLPVLPQPLPPSSPSPPQATPPANPRIYQRAVRSCAQHQKEWQERFDAATTPSELDALLDLLNEAAKKSTKLADPRPRTPRQQRPNQQPIRARRQRYDAAAASALQKLYRQSRPKAFREVIDASSPFCEIPAADLHRHYTQVFGPSQAVDPKVPSFVPSQDPVADDDPLTDAFTPTEVWPRLSRCSNTAPGPDMLRYAVWKKYDSGAVILSSVFNAVQRIQHVPAGWNQSSTVLLHKKGDKSDISNWRPISLSNTIAKVYASVLANRLGKWAAANGRLSRGQKGFVAADGCAEHNFLLQDAIVDARRNRRNLAIAWLDLSNAFGSVPHQSIFTALEYAGLNPSSIRVIRSLYAGCSTTIRASTGPTAAIPIQAGVKQGCPLSPIVFNLALEPLIRAVVAAQTAYSMHGRDIDILAYADDLAVVSESPSQLQKALSIVSRAADWLGLQFNAKKCATLCIDGKNRTATTDELTVQAQRLVVHTEDDFYEHLGTPTGYRSAPTAQKAVQKMTEELEAVDKSLLAPWQKADAVNTFILPCVAFHLKNAVVEKKLLTQFDKKLKVAGKKWMNLPSRASPEVLYLPNQMGGLGLQPLNTLADVSQLVHALRLLESPDMAEVTLASLVETVEKRLHRDLHNNEEVATYLNGSMDGEFGQATSDITNTWTRLRSATRRLRTKMNVDWKWETGKLILRLNQTPLPAKTVEYSLRCAIRDYHRTRLLAKPDQGKVYSVTAAHQNSNHFMRDGRFTRFADWRFVHRARLDCVPLNATKRFGNAPKKCRRCAHPSETLPHVLCHCRPAFVAIRHRHNAILDRLVKAIKPTPTTEVRIDKTVPGQSDNLRPDLVLLDEANKKISIVDVCMPFENRITAFQLAREEKKRKYAHYAAEFSARGYDVFLDALVVGPLGGWDMLNEIVFRRLGISLNYGQLMKKLMCSDAIKWSRDIYVEHLTGNKQYS